MIKSDLLARLAGFGIFYRWHPAIALRYLPFVDEIRKIPNKLDILEVGSAGLGITPYLKEEVIGIDNDFKPPFHPLLKRIKGSAIKLPFKDSSLDVVVSVDMLEHLKVDDREKAISEIIRVAKRKVLIGAPCGKQAQQEDMILHELYKDRFGEQYKFLEEQIEEKLPDKNTILKFIGKAAKKYNKTITVRIEGNENISLHRFLMKGWMTKNLLLDIFFRKILLFLIPALRLIDRPPFYRQLFYITIEPLRN